MTSNTEDIQAKIAQAKDDVATAARRTAESRRRTSTTESKTPVTGDPGAQKADGNGGTRNTRVESEENARGTRGAASTDTTSQSKPELGPVDEESSDEENANAPAPPRSNASPTGSAISATRSTSSGSQPKAPQPNPSSQSQPSAGRGSVKNGKLPEVDADLTAEHNALLRELIDINGQDSYDALAAGVGKLKRDEYLALPNGLTNRTIPAGLVGKPDAHSHLNLRSWAQIYALNKARAPEGADAKVFGMLRLEAVKCGWIDGQREIVFLPEIPNAIRILAEDMSELRDRVGVIKTASFLLPLISEHVFRTFGHHFISTDAANYTDRYNATLRSCLAPEVVGLLPPAVLFHAALHWVSPGRSWRVLQAQLDSTNIPDALRIRANAAPAGTAILTTTAAIVESMSAVGLEELFARYGNFSLNVIRSVTALVKQNPPKYHKSYFAYNVPGPTADEITTLEDAKNEAIRFSPFAQAYINTYMREAALGKAQALKKHAEQNPVQMRRAQNLFRAIVRKDVTTVEDLFRTQIATRDLDE